MYLVTNREILDGKSGVEIFGNRPNRKGPNELRAVEVARKGKGWQVNVLDDKLKQAEAKKLIEKHNLELETNVQHYASLKVACAVADAARAGKRHVLFYVHGFNNDVSDVLARAKELEDNFDVVVVPFSWPANGGGISGAVDYRSDKRDARASADALDRTLSILHRYLQLITAGQRSALREKAAAKHPNNREAQDETYARLLDKACPFTVNALFHSMGAYLLKTMLKSTAGTGNQLSFDNIVLASADANNLNHERWVQQLKFRRRCFITINEDDYALAASRAKAGSDQLARLGHYNRNLVAGNAHYVNWTGASWVGNSHSYFVGSALKNAKVARFFNRAFSGESAESGLKFHEEGNWYGA